MTNGGRAREELTVTEEAGVRFVEGPPGLQFVRSVEDVGLIVEACFSIGVERTTTPLLMLLVLASRG